jgi:hypothetical protein
VAAAGDVADALRSLGKRPSASFGSSCPLLTIHRVTAGNEDLFWVFNPSGSDFSGTGRFAAAGAPYQLDLWNGATALVARWAAKPSGIEIPFTLPAHAATVFMFKHGPVPLHVTATTAEEVVYAGHDLLVRDTQGGIKSVTVSGAPPKTVDLGIVPAPISIDAWHLNVDETTPTGHVSHDLDLTQLKDWRDISSPDLTSAVGQATYTATVDVPAELLAPDRDVLLDVGTVAGAMQLSVNGTLVTNQTTAGGKWAVKSLLHAGANTISVRLDTSLLNKMAALVPWYSGAYFSFMYLTVPPLGLPKPLTPAASGLIGPVKLIPAALVKVN